MDYGTKRSSLDQALCSGRIDASNWLQKNEK